MSASNPEMLAREYSTSDRLQARRTRANGWLKSESEAWEEAIAAIAEVRPTRVLDAGCGDGTFARLIAAPEVVGLDASPAMVAAARSRGLDARQGDIQTMSFEDGAFDVVVCNWTLYHLQDLDRGVGEIARVLRSGGRFVGIYNRPGHMAELWSRVRPGFDASDDYADVLSRHFARVEQRHTVAYTLWETREDVQRYLDAFVEMMGSMTAPDGPYPLKVTRLNCVYVAEAA